MRQQSPSSVSTRRAGARAGQRTARRAAGAPAGTPPRPLPPRPPQTPRRPPPALEQKADRAPCGRVTATEIDYEGSIAIDEDLLERVDIRPYEQVHIYNINSGNRFITYVISAERGSGTFSINGAAARLAQINDRIIVAAYGNIDTDKEKHQPKVLLLDTSNKVVENS